jgi:hypothetical protein
MDKRLDGQMDRLLHTGVNKQTHIDIHNSKILLQFLQIHFYRNCVANVKCVITVCSLKALLLW